MSETAAIEMMAISAIERAPSNAKSHDLGAIITSIATFGFLEPMILDARTGRLLHGHGRHEALLAMRDDPDHERPRGVVADENGEWFAPVFAGLATESDAQAMAIGLALNRASQLGGWDEPILVESLKELAIAGELAGTGFDGSDLDALIASLSTDLAGEDPRPEGEGGKSPVECPRCGERFTA